MVTVVVTGGRDFNDQERVFDGLDSVHKEYAITLLVQGEARGVDRIAKQWAEHRGIECIGEPADWQRFGASAGPIRNIAMLTRHKPEYVVAFPGNRGTLHMKNETRKRGINLIEK